MKVCMTPAGSWSGENQGCGSREHLRLTTAVTTTTSTTTTATTTMMLVVLSLSAMSSVVVASHSVDERLNSVRSTSTAGATLPLFTPLGDAASNTSTTTPPGRAQLPAASRPSPATNTTTPAPSFSKPSTSYVSRSRPDTQTDRSTNAAEDSQRPPANKTARSRGATNGADDDYKRRRFPLISAAQSSSGTGVRRLGIDKRSPAGPSVTTRLVYGAIALVLASVITPLVCLAAGFVRTRIARYLERRRRFDKSGEYERVDSVSSVVDSSSLYAGSQSQLDVYMDDPISIEDVTII